MREVDLVVLLVVQEEGHVFAEKELLLGAVTVGNDEDGFRCFGCFS